MNNTLNIAVLDAATLGDDLDLSLFDECGQVSVYPTTAPSEMAERVRDAHVLIVNKVRCNAETLANASALRLIAIAATGYDNVDIQYCREKGIAVSNVVGYSTDSVAEVTVSMVLALVTHLNEYNAYVKSGKYAGGNSANAVAPVYHEIRDKTWGIYGYGNIGRCVAAVARAFGAHVIVCKRSPLEDEECVTLDELCRRSDILTIHTPLNDGTRLSISRERLFMMKKGSILVNVARGAVLDEAAVTEAVLSGHLGGFASDVYSREPFDASHPYAALYDLPQVILTPHMAWGAAEARNRCAEEIKQNIFAFERGEVRNRVDLL